MERELQISEQRLQHMTNTFFTTHREAVCYSLCQPGPQSCTPLRSEVLTIGAPNQAHICTESQSLRDIRAAPYTRVKEDVQSISYGFDNRRQHAETAGTTVHLSAAMVRNHDAFDLLRWE